MLRGSVSVALLPTPRLIFEAVELAGLAPVEFRVEAGTARAVFALLPLLGGRREIASVALEDARIDVGDLGSLSSFPVSSPASGPAGGGNRLAGFSLVRSSLAGKIPGGGAEVRLDDVSGRFDWPFAEATAGFAGEARIGAVAVRLSGFATRPIALEGGGETTTQLRVASADFSATLEGLLSAHDGWRFNGKAHGDGRILASILAQGDVVPFADASSVSLDADLDVAPTTAQLGNLRVASGSAWLEGSLQASWPRAGSRQRLSLGGTLAASDFAWTPLLAWLPVIIDGQHRWNDEPIALNWLRRLDLDIRMSATRTIFGAVNGEDLALSVLVRDGRFDIDLDALRGYGGKLQGRLAGALIDGGHSPDRVEAHGDCQVEGLDLGRLAHDFPGLARWSGTLGAAASISGSGASIADLVTSLAGKVQLSAVNGEIRDLNFEQALRRLERKPGSVPTALWAGRTAFDKLDVPAVVEQGIAVIADGVLAGPGVNAIFSGKIDMPALRAAVATVATLNGAPPGSEAAPRRLAVDFSAAPGEFAIVPRL